MFGAAGVFGRASGPDWVDTCGSLAPGTSAPWHLSFPYDVLGILVVFLADVFDELGIRLEDCGLGDRPRPRVRLRIVDGDDDVHVPEVLARVTLDDVQRVGHRMAVGVEPSLAVGS